MSVRPSVCSSDRLSVTRRYSVERAKRILKLFSPSGSHAHHSSFFPYQMAQQHSGGVPLTVVSNVGDMKNGDFSTNISLYLGNGTRSSHNIHGVQIKKDATDFFRRNFYKY